MRTKSCLQGQRRCPRNGSLRSTPLAEDRTQYPADDLPAHGRTHRAHHTFGEGLRQAVALAAARAGLAKHDVGKWVGVPGWRRLPGNSTGLHILLLFLGPPLEFLVGGIAIHRFFVVTKHYGGFDALAALLVRHGPEKTAGRHDERALDNVRPALF